MTESKHGLSLSDKETESAHVIRQDRLFGMSMIPHHRETEVQMSRAIRRSTNTCWVVSIESSQIWHLIVHAKPNNPIVGHTPFIYVASI